MTSSASTATARFDRTQYRDPGGLWFWAGAISLTLHLLILGWVRAALVEAGRTAATGAAAIPIAAIAIMPTDTPAPAAAQALPEQSRSGQANPGEPQPTVNNAQPAPSPVSSTVNPTAATVPTSTSAAAAVREMLTPTRPAPNQSRPTPVSPGRSPTTPTPTASTPVATAPTPIASPSPSPLPSSATPSPTPATPITPAPMPQPVTSPTPAPPALGPTPAPAPSSPPTPQPSPSAPATPPSGGTPTATPGAEDGGGAGSSPPATASGRYLATLVGNLELTNPDRDIPTQQATWQSSPTTLEAINYFAPLGIELNGNLQVKVMVLIDRNGQPQVLPDTAQLVQGQISRSKAGQLADRIISGWRFTPTQMAGEPVMQEYWVQLQVRALGR
ncbi:MAG: hypothetical protein HC910_18750 [Spirulinaceae cyanobacterium SM2_1_0]|nr:hypothetical protein [Spirulinaceae cyanobacterium SM2_1_0]